MKKGLNEIIFVLDMTGSMNTIRQETIVGCNNFIEEQKKGPGEARFTLVVFNSNEYRTVYDGIQIADAKPIDDTVYRPDGMTPLLGAVGRAIDSTGKRLEVTREEDRPEKVILVIMTDGEENWSHKEEWSKPYDLKRVADMVKHQKERYAWEVIFLGANLDAFKEADKLGIAKIDTQQFKADPMGIKTAYASANVRTTSYRVHH